ncbi:adhesion G-protein coupled receptor G7 [Notamacropus eugenii]|uniref:adhesion G-protein coupled receptor G7 n=1 Tax=Notamacropus eugenii TaxID=9315 RepID=UPI003B677420
MTEATSTHPQGLAQHLIHRPELRGTLRSPLSKLERASHQPLAPVDEGTHVATGDSVPEACSDLLLLCSMAKAGLGSAPSPAHDGPFVVDSCSDTKMSSCCRNCNPRQLVAIICIPIIVILLGLSIWRLVILLQRGTVTYPTTSLDFCENGGTWEKDGCVCPEQWKGWRCTIVNFCKISTYGNFHFGNITVGKYGPSIEKCESNTANAGFSKATRFCNVTIYGEITLENATEVNCDQNLETLAAQVENITENSLEISSETQRLTSDANMLTAQNISFATIVLQQIFNASRNATVDAKKVAVTTVNQLLDAREDILQNASSFGSLTTELETYSLSLMNEALFHPNIAIQSVDLSTEDTSQPETVLFSVQRGVNDILDSEQTSVDINEKELKPGDQTELQILINNTQSTYRKFGFVLYQNSKFFQSNTFTMRSNFSQRVVSCKVSADDANHSMGKEISNVSVEMIFKPRYDESQFQLHSYACVFWNVTKDDWDTYGCKKKPNNNSQFLGCHCNHTTSFAVLMSFDINYKYPESLDIISKVGCGLSIAGLAFTIIFQIVTRNQRKTSITWVFVSLCTSMLIFNILFLFGIENSNKNSNITVSSEDDLGIPQNDINTPENHTCTVMAALLHYFLLVTLTWTALNAVQLYFLLLRAMKPLSRHFLLFLSLVGWGVPALIVCLTVGIVYPLKGELGYREEIICWLAVPKDGNYLESPLLWSFILPVVIILFSNTVVFIFISVKVLWGRNNNLQSTKKSSVMKNTLSTLSIAVVFGLTWTLGYLMLINDHNIKIIFGYLFCIFNTTQGLQIFILYTARTKVFQNKVSDVFESISSVIARIKMPSLKISLHAQMYELVRSIPSRIERFRLLEQYPNTEETFLSESGQSTSCS